MNFTAATANLGGGFTAARGSRRIHSDVVITNQSPGWRGTGHLERFPMPQRSTMSPIDFVAMHHTPEPMSGCWLWTGHLNDRGYGVVTLPRAPGSTRLSRLKAHRVSYEGKYGAIPAGLFACHRCDMPACVNPDHIFLGTARDNIDDMMHKGRVRKGHSNRGRHAASASQASLQE